MSKKLPAATPFGIGGWREFHRLRMESYKAHPIEVDRHAAMGAAGVELKAAVIRGRPRDDPVAVFDIGTYLLPDHLSHTPSVGADINARPHLQ